MAAAKDLPPLIAPQVEGIPQQMLDLPRWAPWRAEWNEKKQKYEKIPHRSDHIENGLSTRSAAGWVPLHRALSVYKANPDYLAGIGYLMTGPHGIVGFDLDHCVTAGVVDDWAAEIIAKLDSYTEISPSGTGLRIIVAGELDRDWTNHDRGIEVYGGTDARFVTMTGMRLAGSPAQIRVPRAGVMDAIAARYRKVLTSAQIMDLHLPPLIPDVLLPDLDDLDLPPHAKNFLLEGPAPGSDRSQQLFATSIALHRAGLPPDVMLSLLESNEHAMEVALDHRRQDYDKALRYLWKDHCKAGTARSTQLQQLDVAAFESMADPAPGEGDGAPPAAAPAEQAQQAAKSGAAGVEYDFEEMDKADGEKGVMGRDLSPIPAERKRMRFAPVPPSEFLKRKPASWIVKGLLPRASLAVVFGASGAGKTFWVWDMVAAVARGVPWRGIPVVKGRGAYIAAEGAGGFRNRVQAYCDFHGVNPSELDIGVIPDAPNFLDKAHMKELCNALIAFGKLDFVVVDTYARVMPGGNENDAKDVGQVVAHCDLIHRLTGAIVILVHHSGKDASRGARGSSALRAAADVEIEVIRTRETRAAVVAKMKDGDDSDQEYGFKLVQATIGEDEDGFAVTSCVVEHKDGGPARITREEPKGAVEKAVLAAAADLSDLVGDLTYNDLVEAVITRLPLEENKRDRRREKVIRAIENLQQNARLDLSTGFVIVQ
jgi:hypothetical protein